MSQPDSPASRRRYRFLQHGVSRGNPQRPHTPRRPEVIYRAQAADQISFDRIVDAENLLLSYWLLVQSGGPSPGSDGLRYTDFSQTEMAAVLRQMSAALRQQRYRPYPPRLRCIPKRSGGTRVLSLSTVIDRIPAKAVHEAISLPLESTLLPMVMGPRPGRSVRGMLLAVERAAVDQGRWVLVQDDVRHAYPSIRIADALAAYRRLIPDENVLWLIEAILRGDGGLQHTVGVDEGIAIGPDTLNLVMHYALDLPLSAAGPGNPCWYRWADNIVLACQNATEGRQFLQQVRELLQPLGLSLKGGDRTLVDLRRQGAWTEILGFRISRLGDRFKYELKGDAWEELSQKLAKAHWRPDPTKAARECIQGWIDSLAPAFEHVEDLVVLDRVRHTAAQCGFRELNPAVWLAERLVRARASWLAARNQALPAIVQ